jgi:hypothetical protein
MHCTYCHCPPLIFSPVLIENQGEEALKKKNEDKGELKCKNGKAISLKELHRR